jgi:hypothetical protein
MIAKKLSDVKLENLDIMIENCDDYNQTWIDTITNSNFHKRLNEVKIFAKPMRTGKNWALVNFILRYLIERCGIKLIIMTTPLVGIKTEWEDKIQDMCDLHNSQFGTLWRYSDDAVQIMQNLKRGIPTIAYLTNAKAFTSSKFINFLRELSDSSPIGTISLIGDEMDTWSLSGVANAKNTLGFNYSDKTYNASMYKVLSIIAPRTPYIFGMTATANAEVSGEIDTVGNLNYALINPMVAGEQKQYAHMVGWIGEVHYFTKQTNVLDPDTLTMAEAWELCVQKNQIIEKKCQVKRVILIQCGVEFANKNPETYYAPTPQEFIEDYIAKNNTLIDCVDTDEIGVVLTSDERYSFNKFGKIIEKDLTQEDVYEKVNDRHNPVRYFIVINMAGRGMTFPLLKDIFLARFVDRQNDSGDPVTQSTQQLFGRTKNVNVGPEQDEFYRKYNGDVLQVPMFLANADMNVYNLWLPDTRMYREAVRIHKEFDACTKEMLIETEFKHDDTCPCANCNLQSGHEYVDEEEIVQDEVDPVLAIS